MGGADIAMSDIDSIKKQGSTNMMSANDENIASSNIDGTNSKRDGGLEGEEDKSTYLIQ